MSGERYSIFWSEMTFQELASAGVTVTSTIPPTQEHIDEAHRWGIKVCPYISLYKVIDTSKGDLIDDEVLVSQSPFWKAIDGYTTGHPEWYLRKSDGTISRPFNNPSYPQPFQEASLNHQSLIDAYCQGVRNLMDMGADGVFVDNVCNNSTYCYGPQYGYPHDWPELNNVQCYDIALQAVRTTMNSYGNRIMFMNAGGSPPPSQYTMYGDCVMWESFMWRPGGARRSPYTWDELKSKAAQFKSVSDSVTPLTYLPNAETVVEDAFLSYSWATLVGMDQWNATLPEWNTGLPARRDIVRRLYRVNTGEATSDLIEVGDVAYRQFENALIVTNHSTEPVEFQIPVSSSMGSAVMELFDMCEMEVVDGQITLILPAESGRVIVSRAEGLDNLLREIEGQSLAARLYIEEQFADDPDMTALIEPLEEIEADAAALLTAVHETGFPLGADHFTLIEVCNNAAALPTPDGTDAFLIERLDNLRNHADWISYVTPEPSSLVLLV
ncbi:MAG: hypothetical protein JW849_03430 [Phycisphaerae bacterium]|nr:hypothetical protein [Phycisphaerae bacterium]